jgi:hypothetical protein
MHGPNGLVPKMVPELLIPGDEMPGPGFNPPNGENPGIDPTLPIADDPGSVDPTLPITDDPGIVDPTLPITDDPGIVDPTLPIQDDPTPGGVPMIDVPMP